MEDMLEPLINAAIHAGDNHMQQQQQQQQQMMMQAVQQQQGVELPTAMMNNNQPPPPPLQQQQQQIAHTMYGVPPPLNTTAATTTVGGGAGGQPLQIHPTLPRLQAAAAGELLAENATVATAGVGLTTEPLQKKARTATASSTMAATDITQFEHSLTTMTHHHGNNMPTIANNNNLTLNHPENESYKLKTNQYLLETSSRLDDVVSELTYYTSILRNESSLSSSNSNSNSKSNSKSNNKKKKSKVQSEVISNIEKSIVPLLQIASDAVKDAGKYFAPFSGTVNIHNRADAERKRKVVEADEKLRDEELLERQQRQQQQQQEQQQQKGRDGKDGKQRSKRIVKRGKKRPTLLMIDEFVKKSNLIVSTTAAAAANGYGGDTGNMTNVMTDQQQQQQDQDQIEEVGGLLSINASARKRAAAAAAETVSTKKSKTTSSTMTGGVETDPTLAATTESIIILKPKNGSVYTKSEAIAIAKRYRKGSRERGLAIRAMINHQFILASRKTFYRLLQHDEEGKQLFDNGWVGCGRPTKIDLDGFPKNQALVNSSLTFEDLDRGDNRILVTLNNRGGRDDDDDSSGDDDENNEQGGGEDEKQSATSETSGKKKTAKKKKEKKGSKQSTPNDKNICKASGCTNQVARRGLCVKHGLQVVDPKILEFPLPTPRDGGNVYKKSECVEIAKQYKKGSSQRRLCLEAMIHRGYAKNSLKSLYRLLLNDEKGVPITNDDWRGMGCPSVLSANEIDEVIERIKREDIRLTNDEDVRQLILDALRVKGITDESKMRLSATTVKNYGAIFKSKLSAVYWKNDAEVQKQNITMV